MSRITFTGLKNIGTANAITYNVLNNIPIEGKYMVVNLTNDVYGKDLDAFKAAKKACEPELNDYTFPYDSNFIHICTKKVYGSNDTPRLFVNLKEVPVKRETMPMFTYIARLLREISKMDASDMKTAMDFKYGKDGDLFILGDEKISNLIQDKGEFYKAINSAFSPMSVKTQAKDINADLQKQMEDYFA